MAKSKDLKDSKQVSRWLGRIQVAKKMHEDKFETNAKSWRDYYEGNHFPELTDKSNLVVINYTYSILKAILPQIYFQDPYIYLRSKKQEFAEKQQLAEDALNDVWRAIKVKRQIKRIILDMLVMGFGVGKLGYWFETEKAESLETQAGFTEFVKEEYPYFLRQSPFDVVFDFEAKSFDEIRWIAARYYVPLDELKDKYGDKAKGVKGNYYAGEDIAKKYFVDNTQFKEYSDSDLKRVEVWEIEDLVDRQIIVTTDENKEEFLDTFPNPYKEIQSNYKLLFVNEIPDKLYPLSDIANLRDINLWMDKVNSLLMQHILKSQRKIIVKDDSFASEEEKAKFLSGDDMQVVISGTDDVNKAVAIIPASIISPDFYSNNEVCKDHLNNVSGVGANQRGVSDNVERRTAYEAGIMDRNSQLRNSERLDAITDYCISVAGDLLKIMQQYGSKSTEFYNENTGIYQSWKKEDIAGDYNVKIEIGSTVRRDSEAERQFLMQFGSQLIQAVDDNGVPIVDKKKFSELVLKKFDISTADINDAMLSVEEYLAKVNEALQIQQAIQAMQMQYAPQPQPQPQQIVEQPMPMPMEAQPMPMEMAVNPEQVMVEPTLNEEEIALLQGV